MRSGIGRVLTVGILPALGWWFLGNAGALCGPVRAADDRTFAEGSRAGEVRTFHDALGLKLVWCPPGRFQMGSPAAETTAYHDEKPQHPVTLTHGFWLG